jgi:hypothetical protein
MSTNHLLEHDVSLLPPAAAAEFKTLLPLVISTPASSSPDTLS